VPQDDNRSKDRAKIEPSDDSKKGDVVKPLNHLEPEPDDKTTHINFNENRRGLTVITTELSEFHDSTEGQNSGEKD